MKMNYMKPVDDIIIIHTNLENYEKDLLYTDKRVYTFADL